MSALPHRLVRTVLINARRETVFRFFTDSSLFATWWGAGSTIDARPGGRVAIHYPNAVVASGTVESIEEPERIVFTYGYEAAARAVAPGSTRVTIVLSETAEGTLLELTHEFAERTQRDQHEPGWRFQLSLFATVAARVQHAHAARSIDRWFAVWSEGDRERRVLELRDIAEPDVRFRDGFAAIRGVQELEGHVRASQQHMPGIVLSRFGALRECQGTFLVDWIAAGPDARPMARGTNFMVLSPGGRITDVIGFSSP